MILWAIEFIKHSQHLSLEQYGILPLKFEGLRGIFFSPLIHGGYDHLLSNTIPLFVTASLLFYFYREIAFKVFFLIYFTTGIWVWVFAREAYHIGASGLVYGLVSFIFFSGVIRRNNHLMALSLLMVFLYGSTIWGIFPNFFPDKNISWESHLMGLVAGFIFAVFYRKIGMQRKIYEWENEEEDSDRDSTMHISYSNMKKDEEDLPFSQN